MPVSAMSTFVQVRPSRVAAEWALITHRAAAIAEGRCRGVLAMEERSFNRRDPSRTCPAQTRRVAETFD